MSWLKKKPDPISERSRALNSEIASLEAQIKRLDARLQRGHVQPRVRSTALPHAAAAPRTATATPPPPPELIFEDVDHRALKTEPQPHSAPAQFNEMGVRKYDATALVGKLKEVFRGSTPMNPRLVNYLAAGGIQGLQTLRREKRVARNRFILLTVVLFLVLLGIAFMFVKK